MLALIMPLRELPSPPPSEKYAEQPYVDPHDRKNEFTVEQRFQIRVEQEYYCAACGMSCRGPQFHEPSLEIHHIIPIAIGGTNERDNGLGLCRELCHPFFDMLIFEYGMPANVYLEAVKTMEGVQEVFNALESKHKDSKPDLGHKHLRKGKVVRSDQEKLRQLDRKRRREESNLPTKADIFVPFNLTAD